MSVLLPNEKMWGVANWVSRNFFRDAETWLDEAPSIAADIRFCMKAALDTLDLTEADVSKLRELMVLIDRTITANRDKGAEGWNDPSFFPVYMTKLQQLRDTVQTAIDESNPTTDPDLTSSH